MNRKSFQDNVALSRNSWNGGLKIEGGYMEELLKTIKGLVNGIRIPKKIRDGYLSEWEDGYSMARFERQITEARALLLDLSKWRTKHD